jgi:hypothetical protein
MHIHNQPMNLNAISIHVPVSTAAQQAADTRRRLANISSLGDDSDPFESFMVGHSAEEAPQRQQNREAPRRPLAAHADDDEIVGRTLSVSV